MKDQPVGQVEKVGETYSLVMERDYVASRPEVWDALISPGKLLEWLGTVEIDARVGGSFKIDFDGEDQAGGRILLFSPLNVLEFEWGEPDISSTVLFELSETAEGTHLRLTHARQGLKEVQQTGAGWHAHLDVFEAVLVGARAEWEDVYKAAVPRYVESV
ncbi:MAG: SRPBCC family protein [Myxococcales bacterium]|nr:SRPBCC family protein [Myxococcales bacterium]HIK83655.1 SRPBCC family protein [Myxococcales bacterium]